MEFNEFIPFSRFGMLMLFEHKFIDIIYLSRFGAILNAFVSNFLGILHFTFIYRIISDIDSPDYNNLQRLKYKK